MDIAGHVLIIAVGIVVVLVSAHYTIRSSVGIASRLGLSDEFIGMTVLSIGTSLPEIVTHVAASLKILGKPFRMPQLSAIALGTNIGSDVFQQNFLLGVVAIVGTVTVVRKDLFKDVGGLITAAAAVFAFSVDGMITRVEGGLLVLGYLGYLFVLKKYGGISGEDDPPEPHTRTLWKNIGINLVGFAFMAFAADRLLDSALVVVRASSLSYSFFGVIILGVASALPELTTSLISALRRRGSMSAGILIGSNITNPAFALGLGALISGYTVPKVIVLFDLPVKIATAMLIYVFLMRSPTMKKSHAVVLVALFIAYLALRQLYFPADY